MDLQLLVQFINKINEHPSFNHFIDTKNPLVSDKTGIVSFDNDEVSFSIKYPFLRILINSESLEQHKSFLEEQLIEFCLEHPDIDIIVSRCPSINTKFPEVLTDLFPSGQYSEFLVKQMSLLDSHFDFQLHVIHYVCPFGQTKCEFTFSPNHEFVVYETQWACISEKNIPLNQFEIFLKKLKTEEENVKEAIEKIIRSLFEVDRSSFFVTKPTRHGTIAIYGLGSSYSISFSKLNDMFRCNISKGIYNSSSDLEFVWGQTSHECCEQLVDYFSKIIKQNKLHFLFSKGKETFWKEKIIFALTHSENEISNQFLFTSPYPFNEFKKELATQPFLEFKKVDTNLLDVYSRKRTIEYYNQTKFKDTENNITFQLFEFKNWLVFTSDIDQNKELTDNEIFYTKKTDLFNHSYNRTTLT